MGYTHYWQRPLNSEIPPDVWAKIVRDARKLLAATSVPLAFEFDSRRKPVADKDVIRFNGVGKNGHETFLFTRVCPPQPDYQKGEPEVFDFCKTALKPYDKVVCGVLAIIQRHTDHIIAESPSGMKTRLITLSSDGNMGDWAKPLDKASAALGYELTVRLKGA